LKRLSIQTPKIYEIINSHTKSGASLPAATFYIFNFCLLFILKMKRNRIKIELKTCGIDFLDFGLFKKIYLLCPIYE